MSLLETRGLSRRFGGIEAVGGVDFRLDAGEVRALIGPNGAGKTTFVGMISGRLKPSGGQVLFEGRDITRLPSWRRVARGIVYTYQITSVFQELSCHDNVALALQRRQMRGFAARLRLDRGELRDQAEAALARVGLAGAIDRRAGDLPYGHQRLLETAMGLALAPKLLIMDEPTQGLAEDEIVQFCRLVSEIAADATVLLIEHNMDVVMSLADRITVLEQGNLLAEGTPAEIAADAAVQQAYLG